MPGSECALKVHAVPTRSPRFVRGPGDAPQPLGRHRATAAARAAAMRIDSFRGTRRITAEWHSAWLTQRSIERGMKNASSDRSAAISLNSSRRVMDAFKVLVRSKAQSGRTARAARPRRLATARRAARFAEHLWSGIWRNHTPLIEFLFTITGCNKIGKFQLSQIK